MFPKLNLPEYQFKIKASEKGGKVQILDITRKKFVVLTPEEWVRQNFIQYLIREKKYPVSLISTEAGLKYNQLKKRSDIIIYKGTSPLVLIECKAPEIKISQKTFDQAAVYNTTLKAKYLIVTNGMNHYCCSLDQKKGAYVFFKEIPAYDEI